MCTQITKSSSGGTGLILKLSSFYFQTGALGRPFLNPTVATWPLLTCLPMSQGRAQGGRGTAVKPHLFFECGKCYLGLGDFNLYNNLLYFWPWCLKKWTRQHLYSYPLGKRAREVQKGSQKPAAHLAPSAFVPEQRQPAQVIRVWVLTEVLCSKFSYRLGWRTLRAHFPC